MRGVAAQYQELNADAESLQDQQLGLQKQTAALLDVEIGDDDDPVAIIAAELRPLDSRLNQLGQAIQQRQERLDAIEQDLGRVRLVHDYLHQEQKKQVLETIQESEAFKQLEELRDQIAQLVEDADAVKVAVAEVAREEAETRLTTAGTTIDKYFRQLTRNPFVQQLQMTITLDKRTRRNSYDIADQDGKDLTPILSQGDLNALALAIFLGLAASAKESSSFSFLMLDDPSQSLGTEHKKQLAQLLDQVARHKRLIVATMDNEFHECLKDAFTKAKKEYHFGNWSPEEGPKIPRWKIPAVTRAILVDLRNAVPSLSGGDQCDEQPTSVCSCSTTATVRANTANCAKNSWPSPTGVPASSMSSNAACKGSIWTRPAPRRNMRPR